jgi:hypothetical protein
MSRILNTDRKKSNVLGVKIKYTHYISSTYFFVLQPFKLLFIAFTAAGFRRH